jgi:hypothetical protein
VSENQNEKNVHILKSQHTRVQFLSSTSKMDFSEFYASSRRFGPAVLVMFHLEFAPWFVRRA